MDFGFYSNVNVPREILVCRRALLANNHLEMTLSKVIDDQKYYVVEVHDIDTDQFYYAEWFQEENYRSAIRNFFERGETRTFLWLTCKNTAFDHFAK